MKLHKIIGACLLSGLCAAGAFSREVISFNDGWLFKKGPFATDMMKAAAQWEVSIHNRRYLQGAAFDWKFIHSCHQYQQHTIWFI
jgi:hypothetical protein